MAMPGRNEVLWGEKCAAYRQSISSPGYPAHCGTWWCIVPQPCTAPSTILEALRKHMKSSFPKRVKSQSKDRCYKANVNFGDRVFEKELFMNMYIFTHI